jgi:hypothetical protein
MIKQGRGRDEGIRPGANEEASSPQSEGGHGLRSEDLKKLTDLLKELSKK